MHHFSLNLLAVCPERDCFSHVMPAAFTDAIYPANILWRKVFCRYCPVVILRRLLRSIVSRIKDLETSNYIKSWFWDLWHRIFSALRARLKFSRDPYIFRHASTPRSSTQVQAFCCLNDIDCFLHIWEAIILDVSFLSSFLINSNKVWSSNLWYCFGPCQLITLSSIIRHI